MGWQTSVTVHNDYLGTIGKDPDFGKNLESAILSLSMHHNKVEISAHDPKGIICCNAATVIETHHSDQTSVVCFGGGIGQRLTTLGGWKHDTSTPEGRLSIIKRLAEAEGYTLRKRRR